MSADDAQRTRTSMADRARHAAKADRRDAERALDPVLRRDLDARLDAANRLQERWSLYALGLIGLHVLSVVFLQAPWTQRSNSRGDGDVRSGWEIIASTTPGRGWVVLAIASVLISAWCTFVALRRRSSAAFYGVMGASLVQLGAVSLLFNAAVVGVESRIARHGILLESIVAIVTIVTAGSARAEMVR